MILWPTLAIPLRAPYRRQAFGGRMDLFHGLQKVGLLFKQSRILRAPPGVYCAHIDAARCDDAAYRPAAEGYPMTYSPPPTPNADLPISHPLRMATLPSRKPTRFDLQPDKEQCQALAVLLDITAVHGLRFKGEMRPIGSRDYTLEAELVASVEQPCAVTNAPVHTKINETVIRRYIFGMEFPDADEAEMPEDDTAEPMPEIVDLGAVLAEALALALPLYPRAKGAELQETAFTAPGIAPMRDADLRPFAGLADLAAKLAKSQDDA